MGWFGPWTRIWSAAMNKVAPYTRPTNLSLDYKPKLSVTVIIPARDNQEKLDLVLASLAFQSYPAKLTKVIVVDDGSSHALRLPSRKPKSTTIIRFPERSGIWGKTLTINAAASDVKSDVLWFLDSDLVVHPDHLAEHMKWHHHQSEYIVLGWKQFIDKWDYNPSTLQQRIRAGEFDNLHREFSPHVYFESRVLATNDLLDPGLEGFRALVGATFSMRTTTWRELGGYNPEFTTAEDTELGWRAIVHGFTLVPERGARSWHLGLTTFTSNAETMFAHNNPNLANWIPELRHLRRGREVAGVFWEVPDHHVVIDCRNTTLEQFKLRVDPFIPGGKQSTLTLLGPWLELHKRYSPITDKYKDLRAIQDWYQGDPRVELASIPSNKKLSIEEILHYMPVASIPISYFFHGQVDADVTYSMLRNELINRKQGLVGTVDQFGFIAFAVYTPALARAKRRNARALYKTIDEIWGVRWEAIAKLKASDDRPINQVASFLRYAAIRFSRVRSWSDFTNLIRRGAALLSR